jgi:hypothetical protein
MKVTNKYIFITKINRRLYNNKNKNDRRLFSKYKYLPVMHRVNVKSNSLHSNNIVIS